MWEDIKQAARAGVLDGVRWGITAVIVVIALSWLLGDYAVVRQRSQNGQAAFEFIQRQVQAQQQQRSQEKP